MKLNLKQVLALNNLPKPNFDSRRRRGGYSFMYDALEGDDAVAEYENARNRFGMEHVVACACIDYAIDKLGLSFDRADSIIANNFGALVEAIGNGSIDPDFDQTTPTGSSLNHFFLGAVINVVGVHHCAGAYGWFHDQMLRGVIEVNEGGHADRAPAGLIMIDATTVYREMKGKIFSGLGV